MSVEGKRFGVGLIAGLLFALAIVAASGVLSSAVAPLYPGPFSGAGAANTASSSVTTTPGNSAPPQTAVSTATQAHAACGNLSTQASTASTSYGNSAASDTNSIFGSAGGFSSSLAALDRLSAQSRALLLMPVLVAFLLGALVYRSTRHKETDSE